MKPMHSSVLASPQCSDDTDGSATFAKLPAKGMNLPTAGLPRPPHAEPHTWGTAQRPGI